MITSSGSSNQSVLLGFDPGRDKCGLAVMGADLKLYYHQVILAVETVATIQSLCQKFPISLLIMGDQTTAQHWKQQLEQRLPPIAIVMVDERYSSLEARDRYWQMYPPQGFFKLLPRGLRQPPRPVDDIVAIILIERYLQQHYDINK